MRRNLLYAAVATSLGIALAGCSFHPLFATNGSAPGGQQIFHSIYVDPIPTERAGYELRNTLIDLLRGAEHQDEALYRLKIAVKQTVEGTAVESSGDITRYTYTMVADFALSNIKTGAEITKGSETSVAAYDVVASPYSTLVAQQDAQKNASKDIADRIRVDLGVYFMKHPGS
jgi:LPS-assembly lipoprotein